MMLVYAAATPARPFADAALLRFDQAIGYRWLDYAVFVRAHPFLGEAMMQVYLAILVMPIMVLFALAAARRNRRINQYLIAMMISLMLTTALFAAYPALTAWDHLKIDPSLIRELRNLPAPGQGWQQDLREIRAGGGRMLHDTRGSPIVGFPSFHCICGLLFAWALWPLPWLRLPASVAGALMVAASPIFGGHYMADLVGGLVITAVSIAAGRRLEAFWHDRGAAAVFVRLTWRGGFRGASIAGLGGRGHWLREVREPRSSQGHADDVSSSAWMFATEP